MSSRISRLNIKCLLFVNVHVVVLNKCSRIFWEEMGWKGVTLLFIER